MARSIGIGGDVHGSVVVAGDGNVVRVVIAQSTAFVAPAVGDNPCRGLHIFEERHALAFFGREEASVRLWEMGPSRCRPGSRGCSPSSAAPAWASRR